MIRPLLATSVSAVLSLSACGVSDTSSDPTPENKEGIPSKEFEPDDIERAEDASDAVKDYCSGAVSEAQRVGCESHVDESDIP